MFLRPHRLIVAAVASCAIVVGVVAEPAKSASAGQIDFVDAVGVHDPDAATDPTIVRSRPVYLDAQQVATLDVKPERALTLALFHDVSVEVVLDRIERRSSEVLTVFGHARGQPPGRFVLVHRRGVTVASIRGEGGGLYQIRYLGDGVHVVREIDEQRFPPCDVGREDELAVPSWARPSAGLRGGCADDGSVIDLLVVYTAQARAGQGGTAGIEALIALAEAETNQAYVNSQISTSVNVVMTYEVDYVETANSATDRGRLGDPDDGYMDEVHDLRDTVAADVVTLLLHNLSGCGRAYFSIQAGNVPYPELAFNVVKTSCATGYYTFGHELGHNQGARHDRGADPSDGGAFLYSHGYQDVGEVFRTVMAYDCPGGCPRVDHFSNPDVDYLGLATGVAVGEPDSAHNALSISNTALNVANFRRSRDCNDNGLCDDEEIEQGTSQDCNGNGLPDDCDGDCNANGLADECDIAEETSEDCTGNGIPDECEPDCNGNGSADSCDVDGGGSDDDNGNAVPDECEPPILHVDPGATGNDNGISWTDAFTDLQDALAVADASVGAVYEIWVVAGTYTPAGPGGDPEATFQLVSGVGLYGGFAGGETSRDQRDPVTNETILSGDLDGNDGPGFTGYEENSEHVVTGNQANATTVLDGFTITAGGPSRTGGITGAGMVVSNGSPTITNNKFARNQAYGAGGLSIRAGSSPVVAGCTFIDNETYNGGSGIEVITGHVTLRSCAFVGNATDRQGAGLRLVIDGTATVTNCTFLNNTSGNRGGAFAALVGGQAVFRNCVFWGNTAAASGPTAALYDDSGLTVSYSDVQGGAAAIWIEDDGTLDFAAGNIDADPLFSDGAGHLSPGSPCINVGDPAYVPQDPPEDIDREPRIQHCLVDMGADETPFYLLDCNTNGQADACDIAQGTSEDVNLNRIPDECEPRQTIFVDAANCPGPGTGTQQDPFCIIQDGIDAAGEDGASRIITVVVADGVYTGAGNRSIDFHGKALSLRSENGPENCVIDLQGDGRGFSFASGEQPSSVVDGLTITNGYAVSGHGGGISCDASSPTISNCTITGNNATFLGGGVYCEAGSPTIRDCTISSNTAGSGGGLYTFGGSPMIAACSITGNLAQSPYSMDGGGGVFLNEGSPTLLDCVISGNTSGLVDNSRTNGGGLYALRSNATLRGCIITGNTLACGSGCYEFGGGIYLDECDVTLTDCTVADHLKGGGVYAGESDLTLTDCTFEGNVASYIGGGGLHCQNGSATLRDCVFRGNRAPYEYGGGLRNRSGSVTLIQCLFTGNEVSGTGRGGAIHNQASYSPAGVTLIGCTLSGNRATGLAGATGGIYNTTLATGLARLTLTNCILWGNTGPGTDEENQLRTDCDYCEGVINHTCIQGWTGALGGAGNIGDNPLFADADGPDDVPGTEDDDLHLTIDSPCVDVGDRDAVPADVSTDLDDQPRIANWAVDLGVYEYQGPWPTCGDESCQTGENACTCVEDCGDPPAGELVGSTCEDGLDNDCDTLTDCLDPDCQPCCGDGGCSLAEDLCNCPADCGAPPNGEVIGATCHDGEDNDCDTLVDCDDPDCIIPFGDIAPPLASEPGAPPQPDLADVVCLLDDFATGPAVDGCSQAVYGTDLNPCGGNGLMDLDDLLTMLDALAGNPPCAGHCP